MLASSSGLSSDPVGRYTGGATWAHFCATPALWGVILWGRPTQADVARLVGSLACELGPGVAPHASIVDASRVEWGDGDAFRALADYVASHERALARQVERLALVRPGGVAGAIVAGFFEVMPRPYPVHVTADARDGLEWLGAAGGGVEVARTGEDMNRIFASLSGTPDVVLRLRAWLDARLQDDLGLGPAARALAMSERTLQRRLADAGTSLSDEVALARVRVGKRLMLETSRPLTAIALDVGCASLQHFGQLFRRFEGASPSAFRKARDRG